MINPNYTLDALTEVARNIERTELRDRIAIEAMGRIISKTDLETSPLDDSEKEFRIACGAYSYADAMLEVRNE